MTVFDLQSKGEYYWFVEQLLNAREAHRHDFDKPDAFFERCLPVEEIARRGKESLAFGPMRPTGLAIPESSVMCMQLSSYGRKTLLGPF